MIYCIKKAYWFRQYGFVVQGQLCQKHPLTQPSELGTEILVSAKMGQSAILQPKNKIKTIPTKEKIKTISYIH